MDLLFCKLIFALLLLLVEAYGTVGVGNPNATAAANPNATAPPGNQNKTGAGTPSATLHPQDVDAVDALLQLLRRPNLDRQDTNFTSSDCGVKFRYQITCNCSFDNYTCRVTDIDFSYGGLMGQIPVQIGNLTYLESLDLGNNRLHGSIPKSFENLSRLSLLHLYDNDLEGQIPDFLCNLKMLRIISLSSNWFNGSIPKKLSALPSLQDLSLDDNLLMEGIPPELGTIASLGKLELSNNGLSGQLPPQLGNLRSIYYMSFENNEFMGELPQSFQDLVNLTTFNICGNNFSGTIPKYMVNWKKLAFLSLIGNNFEGPLPTEISTLENLVDLHVSDLSGGPGGGSGFSFPNISKLTSLEFLTLRNCSLVGPIPDSIGRISSLNHLDLSFNRLTGGVPTFLSYPHNIFLRRNELNGPLPPWMTNLTITYVDVSENFFTNLTIRPGNISRHLNLFECCSNTTNVTEKWQKNRYTCDADEPSLYDQLHINCGGEATSINGSNYEADLQDDGASVFNMSDSKRWAYSSMGIFQGNIHTYTHGPFIANKTCNITMADAPLYKAARMSPISLKYFGFCLKNDLYTVKLHFAEIVLEETDALSIKGKRVFDVEIQGKKVLENFNIAEEAGGVDKDITMEFNASVNENRLEIHLYWAGKGFTAGKAGSYGPLISAISVSPVHKKHYRLSALSIAGIVGAALLFSAFMLFIFWKKGWFGGKDQKVEEQKQMELLLPGRFFNYRQIKDATQNFSTVNKLGEGGFGSVYKGVLPDGNIVAVKQLSAKSGQGIREFVNEIATISALQHPNLVRLIGCCAEDNQLLLIYEYMENKSLDHMLFGSEELKSRLNWSTRVKICLGIAKGLAFLHEESKLRIIHRDIKPTNILLDKDLNAKISDFGFAKLTEEEKTHVITRVAGTTGYMAPEYAMRGHLTNKADVYSFGVVTLEIVSGKNSASYRPNDQSVYLLDLAYVLQEQGNLVSLVDPALGSSYTWKEAAKILDLAMLCTSLSHTLRPTMSEVVKILEGKSQIKTTATSAPYSMDDFAMAKAMAGISQSTQSGSSTSRDGASDTTFSQSISKEIEDPNNIFADHSIEMVTEQSEKSKKETP